MESRETQIVPAKKKNFFSNIGDRVQQSKEDAQRFMVEQLAASIIPALKKLLPIAERGLKDYLTSKETNGKPKIVLIKTEDNGDISILVLHQDKMQITTKEGVTQEEALVGIHSFDETLQNFITGKMEDSFK